MPFSRLGACMPSVSAGATPAPLWTPLFAAAIIGLSACEGPAEPAPPPPARLGVTLVDAPPAAAAIKEKETATRR